jgi:hypothetical protein
MAMMKIWSEFLWRDAWNRGELLAFFALPNNFHGSCVHSRPIITDSYRFMGQNSSTCMTAVDAFMDFVQYVGSFFQGNTLEQW